MENIVFKITDATCASCASKIIKGLEKQFGSDVDPVYDFSQKQLNVDYNANTVSIPDLVINIKKTGYHAEVVEE